LEILRRYIGKDLRKTAEEFGISVFVNGKKNKGWAGFTLERCISIDPNCVQAPNGLGWELKTTSLRLKNDQWVPKETLAITMINPTRDIDVSFLESHMWSKLKKTIVCGREWLSVDEPKSRLIQVNAFDVSDEELIALVKADYEKIQQTIRACGFGALSRSLCEYIEPGTKGAGHGSTSRAFYASKKLVSIILGLAHK
ncbi:MAG TPA: MutH/Sau3AI family endonuclease, partial [Verrucomicrobiae bacterium]|nr:MutH/Sau3AI family endonuclease [Verrucomicrobiae bacterium]